jgi:flagellar motor protein MotB
MAASCVPPGEHELAVTAADSLRNELYMEQKLNDQLQTYVSQIYYQRVEPNWSAVASLPSAAEVVESVEISQLNQATDAGETRSNLRRLPGSTPSAKSITRPTILRESVAFDAGSIELTDSTQTFLTRLATSLKGRQDLILNIEGHTDNTEIGLAQNAADTWELSTQRASVVARFLIQQGIEPLQLRTSGRGKFSPKVSNHAKDGATKNRRVEIILTPIRPQTPTP